MSLYMPVPVSVVLVSFEKDGFADRGAPGKPFVPEQSPCPGTSALHIWHVTSRNPVLRDWEDFLSDRGVAIEDCFLETLWFSFFFPF